MQENVIINWEKDRFNRVRAYFVLEDDRLSGSISVGEELLVFCKIPRAALRATRSSNNSSSTSGSLIDTTTVDWSAKVWVAAVNRLSGIIEALVSSTSHGKVGFCLFAFPAA